MQVEGSTTESGRLTTPSGHFVWVPFIVSELNLERARIRARSIARMTPGAVEDSVVLIPVEDLD